MQSLQQRYSTEQLLQTGKVIGYGLQYEDCHLEMKRLQGEGLFWQHRQQKEASSDIGIWCAQQQWHNGVLESCMLPDPALLTAELSACVIAELLEPAGRWLAEEVESVPGERQLLDGIYPVLTIGNFSCALINWPCEQWQDELEQWQPYQGNDPLVNASLLAGFIRQQGSEPSLAPLKGGMWLEGELYPEAGESLLWWGRPLAKVVLEHKVLEYDKGRAEEEYAGQTEKRSHLTTIDLWPESNFYYPPLLVELGKVEIGLIQLSQLAPGEEIALSVTLNNDLLIYHDNKVIATGRLLRGREMLLVQIESLPPIQTSWTPCSLSFNHSV